MKSFNIPDFYKSPIISRIKQARKLEDPKKKDFSPSILDFGPVQFLISRHFGFCYGVENAIETAFRAIEENSGKRVFLLSQMIHNPEVNRNLLEMGVEFLMDTNGEQLIDWEFLTPNDIVIIPAFGTTVEIEGKIKKIGIEPYQYNTTCPFVERVWKKAEKLGADDHTLIIHGKPSHEETRATLSHSSLYGKSLVIKDIHEAKLLAELISNKMDIQRFESLFNNRTSLNFNPETDLVKIGVINQTTMLASETQAIANLLKETMIKKFGIDNISNHFADTRDTLCYATNENQESTINILKEDADLAVIVGGYNSSNTTHLVELCERKLPSYFIKNEQEIISKSTIRHFDIHKKTIAETNNFLPQKEKIKIILTSGASCPDAVIERVLKKILSFFDSANDLEKTLQLNGY